MSAYRTLFRMAFPLFAAAACAAEAENAVKVPPGQQRFMSDFIPIDPTKTYEIRAFLKTADPGGKLKGGFMLRYFDAQKREIPFVGVWSMVGTETALTKDVPKDTPVSDVMPDDWRTPPPWLYAVAFDAKKDLSDLPNFTTYLRGKDRRLPRAFPAGTIIRLHRYLDTPCVSGMIVPVRTKYFLTVSGEAERDAPNEKTNINGNYIPKFWNGVKFIKVQGWNRSKDGQTLVVEDWVVQEKDGSSGSTRDD